MHQEGDTGGKEQDGVFAQHLLDLYADDRALARRMVSAFRMDKQWRDRWKDYKMIRERYERVHRSDLDNKTPYANMMQGLVGEFMSVILPNIPDARLRARKNVDPRKGELERAVHSRLIRESEEAANVVVESSLFENSFQRHRADALVDASIYGSGFIRMDEDFYGDPQTDYRRRDFMDKYRRGEVNQREIDKYLDSSGRLAIEWIPVDQVYWEYGKRRVDKNMRRWSILEEVDTFALIAQYPGMQEDILAGAGMNFDQISTVTASAAEAAGVMGASGLDQRDSGGSPQNEVTQVITTWEVVDLTFDEDGVLLPDRIIVKTMVASGTVLLSKEIITETGEPIEWDGFAHVQSTHAGAQPGDTVAVPKEFEFETTPGAVGRCIIPFVVNQSQNHPYGRSMVEQMMIHEDVYNNIIAILMAYSNRGLENNKIFIAKSAMSAGESGRIQEFLKSDDEVFEIAGNDVYGETPDIRRMLMTYQNLVKEPPAQLMNMAQMILGEFQRLAGQADQAAINRSRSAAGKRAQLAATDRPKIMPLENLADSIEEVYDRAFSIFRVLVPSEDDVDFLLPGGISGTISFNKQEYEPLPVLDEFQNPIADPRLVDRETNPLGLLQEHHTFQINSNQIPMKAIADGRGIIPQDPIMRMSIVQGWLEMGFITPETARRLALPLPIREEDDGYRTQSMFEQQQQQLQQMQQQMQQGGVDMNSPGNVQVLNDAGALPPGETGTAPNGAEATLPAPIK